MFGSEILDTAIGLVFIYSLLSLTCSVLTEFIARLFNLRGATLKQAIRQMLLGELTGEGVTWGFQRTSRLPKSISKPLETVDDFYNHSLIKPLFDTAYFWWKRSPSYIDKRTFALVLVDKVLDYHDPAATKGKVEPGSQHRGTTNTSAPREPELKKIQDAVDALPTNSSLNSLLKGNLQHVLTQHELPSAQELDREMQTKFRQLEAAVDKTTAFSPQLQSALRPILTAAKAKSTSWEEAYDRTLAEIEQWFDSTMKRVSGWYTRQARAITFVIALLITLVFNVDSLAIARSLYTNTAVRQAVVNAATTYVRQAQVANPTGQASGDAGNGQAPASQGSQPAPAGPSIPEQSLDQLVTQITRLGVPIGWVVPDQSKCVGLNALLCSSGIMQIMDTPVTPEGSSGAPTIDKSQVYPVSPDQSPNKLAGLALTVIMLSLGAPFWFEMLNKLVNLRSSGAAPEPASKKP